MKSFLYGSVFWINVILFCFVPLGIPILLLAEGIPLVIVTGLTYLLKLAGVKKPWLAYTRFLRRLKRDVKSEIEEVSRAHPIITRAAAAVSFISLTVMILLMILAFLYAD